MSPIVPASTMALSMPVLPIAFLDYMSKKQAQPGRPAKRRKLENKIQELNDGPTIVSDCFTVKRVRWTTNYSLPDSTILDLELQRKDVHPKVGWTNNGSPRSLTFFDERTKQSSLVAEIPRLSNGADDLQIALEVDRDSKKWDGRLRTEIDLHLSNCDEWVMLEISLTIKWDVTVTPELIHPKNSKPAALIRVLNEYFPDTNVGQAEQWTPQDFYQSVHAPASTEDLSAMQIPGLESDLFPFQKRAVSWLLRKEGVQWTASGIKDVARQRSDLPISFIKSQDANGRNLYVSHLFGLVTLDVTPFYTFEEYIKGGILSEEMGLGKTVEMISLISLHKPPLVDTGKVYDLFTCTEVTPTLATLIITPPAILQQWITEIERHAPALKVMHYEGIKIHKNVDSEKLANQLLLSDVVVTTYAVLAAEIYYTNLNGEKSLRTQSKYPRPTSPLMQLRWLRVCLDEAQMVESGVSKAAIMARMIPRVYAWCVTGTPVRKDVGDLQGLLIFLRYYPYDNVKHVWQSLITSHKHDFRRLFGGLALRHSKRNVRNELKLPAQRRYVITMPFTPIEEQHYQQLFEQMCEECGVDTEGAPLLDEWDPEAKSDIMRSWLVRLRQTALHPEIGGRNRRALGQKDGPLRTVDQVLDVMIEQTEVAIRTDQRAALISKLKRGQLYENSPRVQEALDIWTEAVTEAGEFVSESREQLRLEVENSNDDQTSNGENSSDDQDEYESTSRIGTLRNRVRAALEIEHMAVFFQANAYFQIKSNEEITTPDSPEFAALEKLETASYERAKELRQEILQEIYRKADRLMSKVKQKAYEQSFVEIPEIPTSPPLGGLESRRILERLDALATALDAQANFLDEWRETTVQFLLRSLVDEDEDGIELTGEEYEQSHKTQDEVMVYVQALRAVIADRHDAITGQVNLLIAEEVKRVLRLAKKGEEAYPEKTIETLNIRQDIKPPAEMGSLRGIVADLRSLVHNLQIDADNGSLRAQSELAIAERQFKNAQEFLGQQLKANNGLEREIEMFTNLMNTRLEYYRQLQQVSDMVSPYEGPNNATVIGKMMDDEDRIARKIATARSKRRYLEHLRMEATNPDEQRICVICKENFDVGALTICGHQYCKECINLWWSAHKTCPICKRKLLQADLHDITYKPQELTVHSEEATDSAQHRASPDSKSRKTAIYSEISKSKLAEIKNIELDGPSFTTKVDTLARHLIWLRETDPGAKSVIFSQFKDFLEVLAAAFTRYRIGFSSIDRPNGIERFKQDPAVECFLLHARAHSSGLNLVNASHVFLCEPLLNTAIELQAIARVDRIGQYQETNVWLYLVDGTVEESIHQLSVRRRMEHIGQTLENGKGKAMESSSAELLDSNLEEANSMELQHAKLTGLLAKGGKGGEMINKEDLWECLFGGIGKQRMTRTLENSNLRSNLVIGRELRGAAAEARIVE